MRLIDADEAKKLEQMFTLKPSERALFQLMLDRMPTYEPPNPPLTVDELREMEGEPVWYQLKDGQKGYGLVSIEKSEQTVFIAGLNGFLIAVYIHGDYNNRLGAKLYRRKPEEGQHDQRR